MMSTYEIVVLCAFFMFAGGCIGWVIARSWDEPPKDLHERNEVFQMRKALLLMIWEKQEDMRGGKERRPMPSNLDEDAVDFYLRKILKGK